MVAEVLGTHAVASVLIGLAAVLAATALGWAGLRHARSRRTTSDLEPLPFLAAHLIVGFVLIVGAALVFAVLAIAIALDTGAAMAAFDQQLAAALAVHAPAAVLGFFARITHVGDEATLIGVTAATAALLVFRRRPRLAIAWLATCAGNAVLNPSLKQLFVRVRPVHDLAYAPGSEFSFPSGHTSGSVVVYGMLAYVATRLLPARWHLPVLLGAAALVFTIGCSRIVLRVHWASDVVAGFASGSAWLAVCIVGVEAMRHLRRRAAGPSPHG